MNFYFSTLESARTFINQLKEYGVDYCLSNMSGFTDSFLWENPEARGMQYFVQVNW